MLSWFKRVGTPVFEELTVENDKMVERLIGRLATADKPANPPALVVGPVSLDEAFDDAVVELSADMKLERLVERMSPAQPNVERLETRVAVSSASSPMRIIAVASQKGGCGKTTIAAHLAVRAGMVGQGPAVLIDTDPQRSLTEWWQARGDDSLALETVNLNDLVDSLARFRSQGASVAIIDTPPALTASIEQVIGIADLVLIPARPSPHDLRAIGATVDMTRRAGKPFLFVVNGAAPRASITAEAVAALSEHGRVAPGILYQRTDFAASMIDGRTVMETVPNGRSAQEIAELWKCVYAQISMRAAA